MPPQASSRFTGSLVDKIASSDNFSMVRLPISLQGCLQGAFLDMDERESRGEQDCEGHPLIRVDLVTSSDPFDSSPLSSPPDSPLLRSNSTLASPFDLPPVSRPVDLPLRRCQSPRDVSSSDPSEACELHVASPPPARASGNKRALSPDKSRAQQDKKKRKMEVRKQARRLRRRNARAKRTASKTAANYQFSAALSKKYDAPKTLPVELIADELDAANGGWIGLRVDAKQDETTLAQALKDGLKLVRWDGRTPIVLVDKNDNIFGVLAGRPDAEDWDEMAMRIASKMKAAGHAVKFPASQSTRRGDIQALACGVSHGGGQPAPGTLRQSATNAPVVESLITDEDVQRVATYANSCFAFYAPKLYRHYQVTLDTLFAKYKNLERIFPRTVFPAASFNLADRVVSSEHRDHGNLPNGWCGIFSMGSYNPTTGAHLILRNLGLIIEFPPGSLVLLPSSTVTHGNTSIQIGENRKSLALYAAGGLFRWVSYGFRSWDAFLAEDKDAALESKAMGEQRWQEALRMYSKVGELHDDRVKCGLIG